MANPIGEAFVRVLPDLGKFAEKLLTGVEAAVKEAEKKATITVKVNAASIETIKTEIASIPKVIPVKLAVDPTAIGAIKTAISDIPSVVPVRLLLDKTSAEAVTTAIFELPTVTKVGLFLDPESVKTLQIALADKVFPIDVVAVLNTKSLDVLLGQISAVEGFVPVHVSASTGTLRNDIASATSAAGKEIPVTIVPDNLPAFQGLIASAIAEAPVPVAIVPFDIPAFRGLMEAGLAAPPIAVAVLPGDLAAFRAALEAELATAPVGVPVAAVGSAASSTVSKFSSGESPPGKALSAIDAQAKLNVLTERFTRLNQTLSGAVKTAAEANKNYTAVVNLSEAAIDLRTRAENEDTKALERKAKALVATAQGEVDAARASATNKISGTSNVPAELKAIQGLATKATADLDLLAQGRLSDAAATKLDAQAHEALALAVAENNVQAIQEGTLLTATTEKLVKDAAAANVAVNLLADAQLKVGLSSAALRGGGTAQEAQGLSLAEQKKVLIRVNSELILSEEALTAASKTTDLALIRLAEDNLALASSEKLVIDQTIKDTLAKEAQIKEVNRLVAAEARQAAASSKQSALVGRGAGATGLSQLGLRGATLAASKDFLIGAAGATILAKSIGTFASFEETLNTFQVVAEATNEQMKQVSDTAKQLGNDITLPAVSASSAATALTELSKAGLSIKDSLDAARGSLQLATAAGVSTTEAVNLVATALNSFGLAGKEAGTVADVFASAANAAQGNISDFGIALSQSSAVAHQAGISFKDTLTLLALFARNGLKGSDAGTSLRTALIRLIAPTKQASDVINSLGLHVRDLQGNVRPDIFAQFGEATQGMSKNIKDLLAATIFGQDAIRALAIAAREGRPGFDAMSNSLSKVGEASIVASGRTKGLAGTTEALKNSAATLAIQIGAGLAPGVEQITKSATGAVVQLQKFGDAVGSVASHTGPLGIVLKTVGRSLGDGILPVLGLVAAYKTVTGAQNLWTAAQNRWEGKTPALLAAEKAQTISAGVLARTKIAVAEATNVEVASLLEEQLALAKTGAAAAALAVEEAAATKAKTGLLAFASTMNVVLLGATILGGGLLLLGRHESDTTKATNNLTDALKRLAAAQTGFDKTQARFAERSSLEDLSKAVSANAEQRRFAFRGPLTQTTGLQEKASAVANSLREIKLELASTPEGNFKTFLEQKLEDLTKSKIAIDKSIRELAKAPQNNQIDQILNQGKVDEFVKGINKVAEDAQKAGDTLGRNNLLILRDFTRAIGHIPTEKEFKLIVNNKDAKLGLKGFFDLLTASGPDFAKDAALLNRKLKGLTRIIIGAAPEFQSAGSVLGQLLITGIVGETSAQKVTSGISLLVRNISAEIAELKTVPKGKTNVTGPLRDELLANIEKLRNTPEGQAAAEALGKKIGKSLAKGITSTQQDTIDAAVQAVAAANQAVSDAIINGQKQVTDSINSAKTNLGSLTGGLASAVGQVLDARAQKAIADLDKSALGKEIVALQNSLDKSNVVGQRASLKFAIATATDESSRRNAELQLVQFNLQTKLTSDQKELQSKKDTIQKIENAQKESITRQLNAYANEFATGKITFEAFQNDIVKILGKHASKFGDTGKLLGTAFAAAFNAQVAAVLDQASALVGFVQKTKGGTTQFSLTHPAETLAAANRAIQEAKTARDATLKTLNDTRDAIKNKNGGTNGLLADILEALGGKKRPSRGNGTLPASQFPFIDPKDAAAAKRVGRSVKNQ